MLREHRSQITDRHNYPAWRYQDVRSKGGGGVWRLKSKLWRSVDEDEGSVRCR